MSIARPDVGRRREPKGPGRRFGSSATVSPNALCRVLACAVITLAAAPVAADESGPISLSNADVERLHAEQAKSGARQARPAAATPAPTEAELQAMRELDARLKSRLDRISQQSMGNVGRTLDERAVGTAPSSVPPISAGPDAREPVTAPAAPAPNGDLDEEAEPQASVKPTGDPEPACIYGTRGQLLFEPEGRRCASVRVGGRAQMIEQTEEAAATSTRRKEQVGCVYGSRGQLLYASPGVECAG